MPDIVFTSANWINTITTTVGATNATASYGPYPSVSGAASDSIGPGVPFPANTVTAGAGIPIALVETDIDYSSLPTGTRIVHIKLRLDYSGTMSASAGPNGANDAHVSMRVTSSSVHATIPIAVDIPQSADDIAPSGLAVAALSPDSFAEVDIPVNLDISDFIAQYTAFQIQWTVGASGRSQGGVGGLAQYQGTVAFALAVTQWQLTVTYSPPATLLRVSLGDGHDLARDTDAIECVAPHWLHSSGG